MERKRKLELSLSSSRKKAKQARVGRTLPVSVDDLPWKKVHEGATEGGMMMLEEVEGVEVVYGDGEPGTGAGVVRFRIKEPRHEPQDGLRDSEDKNTSAPVLVDAFDESALPAWAVYPLHPALLHSICNRGFETPTEIQKRTLDVFLNSGASDAGGKATRRDIIGIAETGSGKTLAYGLPILHHLLAERSSPSTSTADAVAQPSSTKITPPGHHRPIQALILAPTRELALQVSEHLTACLDRARPQADENGNRPPPPVAVAAIVGGMSAQRQRRVLARGADVVVATPGRFWDLCGEDPGIVKQLRFLVLDEADRMIEAGHFAELDGIVRMTVRRDVVDGAEVVGDLDPPRPEDLEGVDVEEQARNDDLQTFVFSATMSKELQRDLKRGRKRKGGAGSTLDDLLMRLDFRDPDPVVIDLSPEGGRVAGLQESKVECLAKDKDAYLYYFLLRHPGRSLVFVSSIDGIRRLLPLLELLKLHAWPLHSGLQQKQRLRNLDRFKAAKDGVLVATDVAARGLDVPAVDHVVHYQVPRAAEAYVHRNGRTARAARRGFGLVLCAPEERRVFRGVLGALGRDLDDVPEMAVEREIVGRLKVRVRLAREIDGAVHRDRKEKFERGWVKDAAAAMEIEVPSEMESEASDGEARGTRKREGRVAMLKEELRAALAQPLVARGVSTRYITSGSRVVVDDVLQGEHHETLLGLKRVEAGSEVVKLKKRKGK